MPSFLLFSLLFAGLAAFAPFLVLRYQNLGFTGAQIGLLTGITPLITLVVTPMGTALADRTHRHRHILIGSVLATAVTLLLFPLLSDFPLVFFAAAVVNTCFGIILSCANSTSMIMLGDNRAYFGRVRMGGTIGFGLSAAVVGLLVQRAGMQAAFWSAAVLIGLILVLVNRLQFCSASGSPSRPENIPSAQLDPQWLPFLSLAFVGGISISVTGNYLFPAMQELGAGEATMGLALACGTIAEIVLFFFGDRLLNRFNHLILFKASILISALRFSLLAAAATPSAVLWIQLLNGIAAPLFWSAGVSCADQFAPPGLHAGAQGWFTAAVSGIGAAAGGILGGLMLAALGGRSMFFIFGCSFVAILAVVSLLQRRTVPSPSG